MFQNKKVNLFYSLSVILFATLITVAIIYGWTEPGSAPPGGNVPAPLNTSINAQAKEGALVIGTNSGLTTGLIVQYGNVGIGTTAPGSTLDIAGTLTIRETTAPPVSPLGQGRIYLDSTTKKMMISINGLPYVSLCCSPPSQVTGLTPTAGNTQVVLNWTAPYHGSSAITNYKIYRSTPTNGSYSLLTTVGAVLTYTNTGLTNNTTYYYKVSAVNAIGEGSQSAEVNAYPHTTVTIGTQIWMSQNMNVGTLVAGSGSQGTSCASVQKYCYSDSEANCTTDGGLYQWNQAMCGSTTPGVQGICPTGFHIPTDAEFKTLVEGQATAGCESSTGWQCSPAGTNLKSSGTPYFYGVLTGFRGTDGSFYLRGMFALFWSSSKYGASYSWYRALNSGSATVSRSYDGGAVGFSVRCLKD